MDLLNITVLGDPVPKGRPRSARGHHYTPQRTRDAEERLRQELATAYTAEPYGGPVGVELVFYLATRRRTDFDNLEKLILDCLQRGKRDSGGVFLDDVQVEAWSGRLYRRAEGEEPRTIIRVFALE